jgi:CheY-like chemotaxis protein
MGKRILVADDSLTIQRAFAMVLGGQDYALMSARSVDEALVAAKGARPDLIIADAVLENGSGYDLCAAVKADPALHGVPVHILASNQNPLDEARARRVGADGHLLKPFDSQVLLDSVSAALLAPARPAPVAEVPVVAAPRAAPASLWPPVEEVDVEDEVVPPEDDNYGEFTIERGSAAGPAAWAARPPTWPGAKPAPAFSHPAAGAPVGRPSLIPGVVPPTPVAPTRPALPFPDMTPAHAPARTIMGFPAVGGPSQVPTPPPAPQPTARPSVPRPSVPPLAAASRITPPVPVAPAPTPPGVAPLQAPVRRSASMPIMVPPAAPPVSAAPTPVPPTAAVSPAPIRRSASVPVVTPPPASAPLAAAVSSAIDQKVAVIAARGREYEAIAKLSREIIEQVVWEVVPELAEAIIKQEIDRLVAAKR